MKRPKGYLKLTRQVGQSVFIGENNEIEVKLLDIYSYHNNGVFQAAIGIMAPRHIPIVRPEIIDYNNKFKYFNDERENEN